MRPTFGEHRGGNISNCPDTAGSGTQTCNGNGNGEVSAYNAADEYNEPFMFWQHLANAGLVEGSYTGISGSNAPHDAEISVNVPRSKLGNAGWGVSHINNVDGAVSSDEFRVNLGNNLLIGTESTGGNYNLGGHVLMAEEAWNIDTKLDDGLPAQGRVIGGWAVSCTTAADNTELDAEYDLQATGVICHLRMTRMF